VKFIVDENLGSRVARWLKEHQHDVISIYEEFRGLDDDEILRKSVEENRILITNDKDFGEMIFRKGKLHCGVIFLRLEDERSVNVIKILDQLLKVYADQISDNFIVVTETSVRIVQLRI
jgi:predicted nuclease of predicted toxin-antitoxin system